MKTAMLEEPSSNGRSLQSSPPPVHRTQKKLVCCDTQAPAILLTGPLFECRDNSKYLRIDLVLTYLASEFAASLIWNDEALAAYFHASKKE